MKRIFLTLISTLALVSVSSAYAANKTISLKVGESKTISLPSFDPADYITWQNDSSFINVEEKWQKRVRDPFFVITARKVGTTQLVFHGKKAVVSSETPIRSPISATYTINITE